MAGFIKLFLLFMFINSSLSAKILGIFHTASYSHFILGESLFKELAARGHEVTMISPFPQKTPLTNYRDIEVFEVKKMMEEQAKHFNFFKFGNMAGFTKLFFIHQFGVDMANLTLKNAQVQDLINSEEQFDLVIMETFLNEAFFGFCHRFKTPCIIVSTSGASVWSNRLTGNPNPPSYIVAPNLPYTPNMTFLQRVYNFLNSLIGELITQLYFLGKHNKIMHEVFPDAPHLSELMYNTSFVLLNSHPGLSAPVPLVPNMKEVGGFHIVQKELPKDIKKFLDDSKEGVIFFALGSNVKSKDLPPEKIRDILAAFKRWNKPVLWKFEEEDLPGKTPNIKISKWLPQTSVLAHPNVKAFITHGGRLSTLESIYFGVPIIGIPIFAEQPFNIAQAEHAGYGISLQLEDITENNLYNAIVEITSNKKYVESAKIISRAMQSGRKPIDEAIYWIEYVLKFNGAPHLRNYGINLSWYQYLMIDVLIFLMLAVLVSYSLCCFIYKMCKTTKVKKKEKLY